MQEKSSVFEKHYHDYCLQIAGIDFPSVTDILDIGLEDNRLVIPFFGKEYFISKDGMTDDKGQRPDYVVCVILAKYLLLCPDKIHSASDWVSFKDFKSTSHFLNVNFFASDTEKPIIDTFSGNMDALLTACKQLKGLPVDMDISYDLAMRFDVLPRVSLLLLFNDGDEEFPPQTSVLFLKQSEHYLDPESLAMTSAFLAKRLTTVSTEIA